METEKKCKLCLHKNVCVDYKNIKDALSKTTRGALNDKDEIANNIANKCDNYLVYDERSTEVLLKQSYDAKRSIKWCIAMCKNKGEVSKNTLMNESDEWFKDSFVDCLERGYRDLNSILK